MRKIVSIKSNQHPFSVRNSYFQQMGDFQAFLNFSEHKKNVWTKNVVSCKLEMHDYSDVVVQHVVVCYPINKSERQKKTFSNSAPSYLFVTKAFPFAPDVNILSFIFMH